MNRFSHLYRGGLLLLALALLLAACGGQAPAEPDDDGSALERTDITMRFQWIPQWQFAGYIAAEVNGYYDEAGLHVTLNGGGPDFPTKQLVASGAEQFGTAWVDSMYLSQQQDIPLVALATLLQVSPSAYMVHADAGIAGVEDFPGHTIGMFYGGGVETEYRAMLRAAGVEREAVDEVPGTFSLEPFLSRRVDIWPVYVTDQPFTVQQQGVDFELIYARDYGVILMGDVLFATRDFIEQNPNTVEAFVHASLRGWEWALTNPEASIDMILDYNPQLNREQLTFEAERTIELLQFGIGERCVGYNDPAAWEAEQQLMLDLAILDAPVPFEAVADNTFVDGYYQQQGVDCLLVGGEAGD